MQNTDQGVCNVFMFVFILKHKEYAQIRKYKNQNMSADVTHCIRCSYLMLRYL